MSRFSQHPDTSLPDSPKRLPSPWLLRLQGLGLIILSLCLVLVLLTYHPAEMGDSWLRPAALDADSHLSCTNVMGFVGLYLAGFYFYLFGAVAWWLCALVLFLGGRRLLYPLKPWRKQWICVLLLILFGCAILSLQDVFFQSWVSSMGLPSLGGELGDLLGPMALGKLLGSYLACCVLILAHAITITLLVDSNPVEPFVVAGKDVASAWRRWRQGRASKKMWEKTAKHPSSPSLGDVSSPSLESYPVMRPTPPLFGEDEEGSSAPLVPSLSSPATLISRGEDEPAMSSEELAEAEVKRMREQSVAAPRMQEPPSAHRPRSFKPVEIPPVEEEADEAENDLLFGAYKPAKAVKPVPEPAPPFTPKSMPKPKPAPVPKSSAAPKFVHPDDYPIPDLSLLHFTPPCEEDEQAAQEEMESMQRIIIEKLQSFDIEVEAGDITRGPSITRYEIYPPRGLRVNRITHLKNDFMLATSSASINILAPIPGKNTVGIELANAKKTPVFLRELMEDDQFCNGKFRIPVALGKDVYGRTVIGDLAAMPHTLVAGTTGSGKSVCINSMIISMLYKFTPEELKLVLIDPKVVEMQPYRKLPHLACPVVTDPGRVIGALRWAVNEMEHRYHLFSKMGVRNFEDFNSRPEGFMPEEDEEEYRGPEDDEVDYAKIEAMVSEIERQADDELYLGEEEEDEDYDADVIPAKLPYIVIIIDELADLMMIVKEDVENYIARLTQKARAAGIHLVVATQTPRSNVVTGIIKANIPSRIAFKVSSPLDSRIILDTDGAENLLGQGDFLFIPPGGISKMMRAQGAFVSDEEVSAVVKHCASHAKQQFVKGATTELEKGEESEPTATNGGRLGTKDMNADDAELYTRCLNLVVTERKASTSLLQRRFSIGYGRAAKIMDMLEERGIISSQQGTSRPREVLVEPEE